MVTYTVRSLTRFIHLNHRMSVSLMCISKHSETTAFYIDEDTLMRHMARIVTLYWYSQLVGHPSYAVYLCVSMCMSVCVCVSADMLPYCSAHDEWLFTKLYMYVVCICGMERYIINDTS